MRWVSLVAVLLVAAAVAVLQSDRFAREVATAVRTQFFAATGLELRYATVRVSWSRAAVRIEGIRIRRPTEGCPTLVALDAVEVTPALRDLLQRRVRIRQLSVDGGSVNLAFERLGGTVRLRCGPVSRGGGGGGGGEVPLRDVAVSDVRVRVRHPDVGDVTLGSVDLDLLNLGQSRWSVGFLAVDGVVRTPWFAGGVPHAEARLTFDGRTGSLYVASAQIGAGTTSLRVRQLRYDAPRHRLDLDARADTVLEDVLPRIHGAPDLEGAVSVDVRGSIDDVRVPERGFHALARVSALGLALHAPDSTTGAMLRYSLGDRVRTTVDATPERILATDFSGGYASAVLHADRLSVGLRGPMALDGALSIQGLDFTELMNDATVTPRTKILWTLSGEARLRGTLSPLHLIVDLPNFETRDFAVLRDFFTVQPQRPVVQLARARISSRMEVDPVSISWNDSTVTFGQSRVTARRIRVRTTHDVDDSDGHDHDIKIEGLDVVRLHLADVGAIADIPIAGDAVATVALDDDDDHPRVHGIARIAGFTFGTFPFGDLATAPGTEWQLLDDRLDAARMDGVDRRSRYAVHSAYLDFRQYDLRAGARVHGEPLELADFYDMFHFTGDPTLAPYDGRGVVDANVDYVLGRPGDDRDGVMTADVAVRGAQVTAFGEHIDGAEARVSYTWLRRRDGVRGARVSVERFTGTKGGGRLRASGAMDLGANMHFVAEASEVPMGAIDAARTARVPASGLVSALVTLEGTPDAPRFVGDLRFRDLTVLDRPLGDVDLHVSQLPDGPPATSARPVSASRVEAAPPTNRIDVSIGAMADQLHADLTLRVPWEASRWRDAAGVWHPSHERAWGQSSLRTHVWTRGAVDVLPWLPPSMLARAGADARVEAGFDFSIDEGRLDALPSSTGHAQLRALHVEAGGLPVRLGDGAVLGVCFRGGTVWIPQADAPQCGDPPAVDVAAAAFVASRPALLGPDGTRLWIAGSASVGGDFSVRDFDAVVRGEADLAQVAARVPQLTYGRGVASFQVRARGTPDQPQLSGGAELHDGSVGVAGMTGPLHDIELDLRVDGSDAVLRRASARYGQGLIAFTRDDAPASAHFDGTHIERVDVPIIVRDLSLSPDEGIELAANADARLRWQVGDELPLLQGVVDLTRARYTRPIPLSADVAGRLQGRSAPAPAAAYDPARDLVRLDVQVRTPTPMRIANNLADAELRLDEARPFRIVGTAQRPGIVGSMQIVRGLLRVYDNEFDVRRGVVDFDNPDHVAARFDINAQTEVRRTGDSARSQWRVNLHAYGTPEQFSVDLSAEPTLSREDIVLMLLFRLTRLELERIGAANAAQTLAVEALSRGLGLDQLLNRVLPVFDDVRIGSAYNPRTNRTEPQLNLGRQVFDWLRLGGSTTASDNPIARFTADVRLRGGLGVQALVESANNQLGAVNANAGADLRWRMEFQ